MTSKLISFKNLKSTKEMDFQPRKSIKIYLWTTISVFFLNGTFLAIISVANSRTSTNDASSLVASIIALVANSDQSARPHIRVANDATAVTFFTQTTNGHPGLFTAKNQVWMMFCHALFEFFGKRLESLSFFNVLKTNLPVTDRKFC